MFSCKAWIKTQANDFHGEVFHCALKFDSRYMPLSITKPDIKWPFQCSLKNSDTIPKGIPMKFLKSAKIYSIAKNWLKVPKCKKKWYCAQTNKLPSCLQFLFLCCDRGNSYSCVRDNSCDMGNSYSYSCVRGNSCSYFGDVIIRILVMWLFLFMWDNSYSYSCHRGKQHHRRKQALPSAWTRER